jgi:Ca2+-transporting ATPase
VFARIMPDQKLRLVNALKAKGEIVAMTGDGVNDAPALKAAHIGVAMGGRGADVAREAAAIVLLDDDFGSIVKSIRLGRRIYDNLRKAAAFIVAVHVPIAGLAIAPLLAGTPVILGPVHIAFLEMFIDPVCALVFEAEREEDDVMRRPPRSPQRKIVGAGDVFWSAIQGAIALACVGGAAAYASYADLNEAAARTTTFLALVATVIALVLANRSFSSSVLKAVVRPSRPMLVILPGVVLAIAAVLAFEPVRTLFGFEIVGAHAAGAAIGAGIAALFVLEALKFAIRLTRPRLRVATA